MNIVAVLVGVLLVVSVLADLINTLVAPNTSTSRWWLTGILYRSSWKVVSFVGKRLANGLLRERIYSLFAPISVLVMLVAWVAQQVIGFGLIWWGLRGGIEGVNGLLDSFYFSGVVYFTIGFGEVVPLGQVPRLGALVEAFSGLLTVALVIGYLPALYSAYSEREQKLLTLDDGSENRITPTNLVIAHSPDGNIRDLDGFFEGWEAWMAQVLETHTTFPMLRLFRSQHEGQSWITALGLVADSALHVEVTEDGQGRSAYWALRRAARLMQMLAEGADLSKYRERLDASYKSRDAFDELYLNMASHGFEMISREEAWAHIQTLRRTYDAQLEWLIDTFEAPRGFWGHNIGHVYEGDSARVLSEENTPG